MLGLLLAVTSAVATANAGLKNVLFFISDDLRPEMLGAFGQKQMITPNLDKLAETSTVFNRAYCQQAICGPTRNSFLSGRRPQRTKAWNFIDHFREPGIGQNWMSLPGYFLDHGYTCLGGGKTYHPGLPPNNDGNKSWSMGPGVPTYVNHNDAACTSDYFPHGASTEVCPDNKQNLSSFSDYANLEGMIESLHYASELAKKNGTPFFLNYGIHKPHLPFHFPATFGGVNIWEKYGPTGDIALPTHQAAPKDMPPIAFTYEMDGKTEVCAFGECEKIPGPEQGQLCPFCGPALSHNMTQTMRKGYYSAVSWVDFLVGAMLSELDNLGHTQDTVVALVGDHGWQLGEHNIWGKHSNFELGTRVPLIIRAAGQTTAIRSNTLVESVDIYPTLAALAGLPAPPDLDGYDLTPIWQDPNTTIKNYSFSEYPRCAPPDTPWQDTSSCVHTQRTNFTIMGYSVRDTEWRATFWMWWDGDNLRGDFSRDPAAIELYAHAGDPESDFNAYENTNVAAANSDIVQRMLAVAKTQWANS
eukprot:m.182153 g.182153  ORF g.182153 m.182153 type:complete len:528 (+) comp15457_c0_seq1:109-1692(+)